VDVVYFPYPLRDLRSLGMTAEVVPTRLGDLRLYRAAADRPVEAVFLHGVNLESSGWSPLVQAAGGSPATGGWAFLDLPGFGGSAPLTRPLSLDEASGAVVDVIDHLGVPAVHVVGHSMGGFLALHLAQAASARVRTLVTVNGAYSTIVDVVNRPWRTLLRAPLATVPYLVLSVVGRLGDAGSALLRVAAATGLLRASLFGLAAHPLGVPRSMLATLARDNRPGSFRLAERTGEGHDCEAVWRQVQVPTVAMFGRSDRLVSDRDRRRLSAAMPAARTVVVPQAGHLLPMEHPGLVTGALRRLIDRTTGEASK
jgi:pimeloyl-ACP methyl ester carboxylesterase